MPAIRYDRSPAVVELKMQWAKELLNSHCRNKLYDKLKAVKTEIIKKQGTKAPGVVKRKITLLEFCNFYSLPVNDCAHLLNNRFLTRIIIPDGPYQNQNPIPHIDE
jgi:hypothetical protein